MTGAKLVHDNIKAVAKASFHEFLAFINIGGNELFGFALLRGLALLLCAFFILERLVNKTLPRYFIVI